MKRDTTLEKKIRKVTGMYLRGNNLTVVHFQYVTVVRLVSGNTTFIIFFKRNAKYNKSKGVSKYSLTRKKVRISN